MEAVSTPCAAAAAATISIGAVALTFPWAEVTVIELYGEEGKDVLVGGRGDDSLAVGAGRDVFVFSKSDGSDVIDDFQLTRDLIRIGRGANATSRSSRTERTPWSGPAMSR